LATTIPRDDRAPQPHQTSSARGPESLPAPQLSQTIAGWKSRFSRRGCFGDAKLFAFHGRSCSRRIRPNRSAKAIRAFLLRPPTTVRLAQPGT
jgi:hypothetical protein